MSSLKSLQSLILTYFSKRKEFIPLSSLLKMQFKIYSAIGIMLLLCTFFVASATIEGRIYDFSLNEVKNVVVQIDTMPLQKHISKESTYSFQVPKGEYTLQVQSLKEEVLASEKIEIKDEGTYIRDIILFQANEDALNLTEDSDTERTLNELVKENSNSGLLKYFLILIFLLFVGTFFYLGFFRKKESTPNEEKRDDLSNDVLNIIKKEKRLHQRELRKLFPFSEAKLSLVISELESKGKIEKIKKGRGNILIYKK